ncbi:MAG: hypothetical protein K2Y37_02675 [Pirellulales bacterium]|nr:hypothetical protein [Pirellulales bacterium]
MAEQRRSLTEGLKTTPPPIDKSIEKGFVYQDKAPATAPALTATPTTPRINRVPIGTRMREDFSKALKRASLERQLEGVEPNSLQDILEEAVEPWLKSNGYLK